MEIHSWRWVADGGNGIIWSVPFLYRPQHLHYLVYSTGPQDDKGSGQETWSQQGVGYSMAKLVMVRLSLALPDGYFSSIT